MKIDQSSFVKSASKIEECPEADRLEYAFIGRSNVGKSSLINMICGRKDLAKTSGTPGKTQLINHFLINESWYLVDLPGYGYAKVSKKARAGFGKMIQTYISERKNLINLFVLIDSRHKLQQVDADFMEWLGSEGIPFSIIFTKCDKLGSSALHKSLLRFKKQMLETWESLPMNFQSSATDKRGKDDILDYIAQLNQQFADMKFD